MMVIMVIMAVNLRNPNIFNSSELLNVKNEGSLTMVLVVKFGKHPSLSPQLSLNSGHLWIVGVAYPHILPRLWVLLLRLQDNCQSKMTLAFQKKKNISK